MVGLLGFVGLGGGTGEDDQLAPPDDDGPGGFGDVGGFGAVGCELDFGGLGREGVDFGGLGCDGCVGAFDVLCVVVGADLLGRGLLDADVGRVAVRDDGAEAEVGATLVLVRAELDAE